jgi:hypothetical protein
MYYLSDGVTPDYFPNELRDKHTKEVLVRPHWDKVLQVQLVWYSVFENRFFDTVPNSLADIVCKMPPNVVQRMLNNGAFRTLRLKWKAQKKPLEEIERIKRLARQSQRKADVSKQFTHGACTYLEIRVENWRPPRDTACNQVPCLE